MKKIFYLFIALLTVAIMNLLGPRTALANPCPANCTNIPGNACPGAQVCVPLGGAANVCQCIVQANVGNPLGFILNPIKGGALGPRGNLAALLNNVLRLIYMIAGIFALFRILLAGLKFISAGGDAKAIEQAWTSIWQALLGLAIVVSSIAIAALLGLFFFGDPRAILNPQVYGPI